MVLNKSNKRLWGVGADILHMEAIFEFVFFSIKQQQKYKQSLVDYFLYIFSSEVNRTLNL